MMNAEIAKFAAENNINAASLAGLFNYLLDGMSKDPVMLARLLEDRSLFEKAVEVGIMKYSEYYAKFCNNVIDGINGRPNADYEYVMAEVMKAFYPE